MSDLEHFFNVQFGYDWTSHRDNVQRPDSRQTFPFQFRCVTPDAVFVCDDPTATYIVFHRKCGCRDYCISRATSSFDVDHTLEERIWCAEHGALVVARHKGHAVPPNHYFVHKRGGVFWDGMGGVGYAVVPALPVYPYEAQYRASVRNPDVIIQYFYDENLEADARHRYFAKPVHIYDSWR